MIRLPGRIEGSASNFLVAVGGVACGVFVAIQAWRALDDLGFPPRVIGAVFALIGMVTSCLTLWPLLGRAPWTILAWLASRGCALQGSGLAVLSVVPMWVAASVSCGAVAWTPKRPGHPGTTLCLWIPLGEEIVFRAMICCAILIRGRSSTAVAATLSGAAFAIVHIPSDAAVGTTTLVMRPLMCGLLGSTYAMLFVSTRLNVLSVVIAHASLNYVCELWRLDLWMRSQESYWIFASQIGFLAVGSMWWRRRSAAPRAADARGEESRPEGLDPECWSTRS